MADAMVKYTGPFMYIFKPKPTAPPAQFYIFCLHILP